MNFINENISPDMHPDHEDIALVADGNASAWIRETVIEHTDSCERCRFVLAELVRCTSEIGDLKPPKSLSEPVKLELYTICPSCSKRVSASGETCPECGKNLGIPTRTSESPKPEKRTRRPWHRQGDTTFIWIAGCMFFISLLLPRYTVHFLSAGGFFGILAIIDYSHRNIFAPLIKAWREGDEEKAEEVIEDIKEHFKIG
jgi:hypothetical protein